MKTDFSQILEYWYQQNGRSDLPWRKVSDPYLIWISETILQQTRVAQGYDYYLRFIERFPNVETLALADEDEVLKLWQGLGYYSRARNLHFAAKTIYQLGSFPHTYEEIKKLKGVGDYTAAAISSFAFHLPYAVVDGNVYRVLSRIFGIHTPIDTLKGKKEFTALANELLDKQHSYLYNSAIMDFGALVCTPKTPNCDSCPFSSKCYAAGAKAITEFPVKSKKVAVSNRFFIYVYIEDDNNILLRRREKGDIWQGLYEPYLIEFPDTPTDVQALTAIEKIGKGNIKLIAKGVKHVLTHRRLWIDCYSLHVKQMPSIDGFITVSKEDRYKYATPKVVTTLFDLIDNDQHSLFG